MRSTLLLLLATIQLGCGSDSPHRGIPLDQLGRAPDAGLGAPLTGTVLEKLPAGQYVYLRLKTGSGEAWAAVTATAVGIGEQVTITSPVLMQDFESTALNRTFAAVYFGGLARGTAADMPAVTNPHEAGMQSVATVNVGAVEKADGPGARTVAETWAQKGSLDGKTVTIRGVVVKLTEGVMGKNWLHLQDGTGDPALATNDITVVSSETAAPGATVTITGTVRTNRDIGAGYVFAVLVENATLVK